MIKIFVDNKELFINKSTTIQLEVSNSIFSTDKTDGEIIYTFDVPAAANDLIFNHARFVYVQRMKKYNCRIEVGGYLIGQGDLYIQKSNSKSYSIGIVVNPFPENFQTKLLKENDFGDDIIISDNATNHNSKWINFLKSSLDPNSFVKFPLFFNQDFYGDNNQTYGYYEIFNVQGVSSNNLATLTQIKGDTEHYFVNRLFFDENNTVVEDLQNNRGIRIFNRYGSTELNSFAFCPAFNFIFILEKIFKNAGYKINGNFVKSNFAKNLYIQSLRALDGGETQYEINTTVKELTIDDKFSPIYSNEQFSNAIVNSMQMEYSIDNVSYNTFKKSQFQNTIEGKISIKTFIPSSVFLEDPDHNIIYRLALIIIPENTPLPDYWQSYNDPINGWSSLDGQGGRYIQPINFPNGDSSKKFPTEWYGGYIKVWGKDGDIDGSDINYMGSGFYQLNAHFLLKQNVDTLSDLQAIKYKVVLAKVKLNKIVVEEAYTYRILEYTKFVPSAEYEPQFFIHNIFAKKFNIANFMANLNNEDFITEMCNFFGLALYIDSTKREIELSFIKDILKKSKYIDLSKYVISDEISIENLVENKYNVSFSSTLDENIPETFLDDVEEFSLLPSAKLHLGKFCYVRRQNAIFNAQQVGSDTENFIYKWIVYSGNSKKMTVGDSNDIELNSKIKIPYLQPSFNDKKNGMYPVINIPGCSDLFNKKSQNYDFDLILLNYSGVEKFYYKKLDSFVYKEKFGTVLDDKSKVNGYDLTVNTNNSIGKTFLFPWLNFISKYETLKYKFNLPISVFLEVISLLKPQDKASENQVRFVIVNNIKLIPIKMIFEFRIGREFILTEIEFAKETIN